MAYLYRHIRLDKNEPFYIGIGLNESNNYKRAYWTYERNFIWKKIVAKTNYEVEIVLDNLTWEEACEKEKEFIKLYGRKNINSGILSNMTDGGDGAFGMKHSAKTKLKISLAKKGKIFSEEHKKKIGLGNKDKIISTETKKKQSEARKGHKQKIESIEKMKAAQAYRKKKVDQFDLNMNFIKTHSSISSLIPFGFCKAGIIDCCKGKFKQHKQFIFRYHNN